MICRRFRPADKPAVMALLSASYGGWHGELNEAFWTWKFERNPHGEALIYVADDGGRVAGCYILIPVKLRVGDAEVLGAQSVDAAVDPDYRGRHIFTELARETLNAAPAEGIELAFAFPTIGAFRGQVRVGYTPRFVVPKIYRPLLGPLRRRPAAGLALRDGNGFDSRFDCFSKPGNSAQVTVVRDPAYLQWRYSDHPVASYTTILCEHAGEVHGYCVIRAETPRRRIAPGYVIDFQVRPGSRSAAGFLADEALHRMRALGARVAVTWERPAGPEQEALSARGFSGLYGSIRRWITRPDYVDQLIAFDCRRELDRGPATSEDSRWSLVPGDADYT